MLRGMLYYVCLLLIRVQCHKLQSNLVASGGLGGEVFIWDIEAALAPVSKSGDSGEDDCSNGSHAPGNSLPITTLRTVSSSNSISAQSQCQGYVPVAAKGHKESVYALAMNETGTLLVSGGTEKVYSAAYNLVLVFFELEEWFKFS